MRRPGCVPRVDPDTNCDTQEMLLRTGERVHASARVRLALGGLAMDDRRAWPCDALLRDDDGGRPGRAVWRLERDPDARSRDEEVVARDEPSPLDGDAPVYSVREGDGRWRWVYEEDAVVKNGVGKTVRPLVTVLPEEPMVGYWERHLLALTQGDMDVWRLAEEQAHEAPSLGKIT